MQYPVGMSSLEPGPTGCNIDLLVAREPDVRRFDTGSCKRRKLIDANPLKSLEAGIGIEPIYMDLQSSA